MAWMNSWKNLSGKQYLGLPCKGLSGCERQLQLFQRLECSRKAKAICWPIWRLHPDCSPHQKKQVAVTALRWFQVRLVCWVYANGAFLIQTEKRTDNQAIVEAVQMPTGSAAVSEQRPRKISLRARPCREWALEAAFGLGAGSRSKNRIRWQPGMGGQSHRSSKVIQTDMAVNRFTKHLNVNASRLLEKHQVKYENKTKHAGRRIRLTYMVVEAPAFEVIG